MKPASTGRARGVVSQGGEDKLPEFTAKVYGMELQEAVGVFREAFLDRLHNPIMLRE